MTTGAPSERHVSTPPPWANLPDEYTNIITLTQHPYSMYKPNHWLEISFLGYPSASHSDHVLGGWGQSSAVSHVAGQGLCRTRVGDQCDMAGEWWGESRVTGSRAAGAPWCQGPRLLTRVQMLPVAVCDLQSVGKWPPPRCLLESSFCFSGTAIDREPWGANGVGTDTDNCPIRWCPTPSQAPWPGCHCQYIPHDDYMKSTRFDTL